MRPTEAQRSPGWRTNTAIHSIDLHELESGGPRKDGIPAIHDPKFVSVAEAHKWLRKNEPVIALEIDKEARAYPLQILVWQFRYEKGGFLDAETGSRWNILGQAVSGECAGNNYGPSHMATISLLRGSRSGLRRKSFTVNAWTMGLKRVCVVLKG